MIPDMYRVGRSGEVLERTPGVKKVGTRSATVTATTDLVCYGLTYWDFRPLVQENAAVAWGLLQSLAKRLRHEHACPIDS